VDNSTLLPVDKTIANHCLPHMVLNGARYLTKCVSVRVKQ